MSVPIWLTLIRMALAVPRLDAPAQALRVGDEDVVAHQLDRDPERAVSAAQPSQSSSAMPSSIETIG